MYEMDAKATAEIIERMKASRIGNYAKWNILIKKIRNDEELSATDANYLSNFTRIYKSSRVTAHSRILHLRLSDEDPRPKCQQCGKRSEFYCNQNDAYFCRIHVIGHDENEI